jgi:hypothetical protein
MHWNILSHNVVLSTPLNELGLVLFDDNGRFVIQMKYNIHIYSSIDWFIMVDTYIYTGSTCGHIQEHMTIL